MRRVFTLKDQQFFANLSGDFNPLHLDEVYARRVFAGEPVVHGIHSVLWGLECAFRRIHPAAVLCDLKGIFLKPLYLNRPVACVFIALTKSAFEVHLIQTQDCVAQISGNFKKSLHKNPKASDFMTSFFNKRVRDLAWTQIAHARGQLRLNFNTTLYHQRFKHLSRRLPDLQVAALLASTRLAGMSCPGLNSIYQSFNFKFDERLARGKKLRYRVREADRRFSSILIQLDHASFSGSLKCYVRPRPQAQPRIVDLRKRIKHDTFRGERFLIIGGSRGLGELTAKLIVCGGGRVMFTYYRGKAEAQALTRELNKHHAGNHAFLWDIQKGLSPRVLKQIKSFKPATCCYFATPNIFKGGGGKAKRKLFQSYYVDRYRYFLQLMRKHLKGRLKFFYPSSTALDQPLALLRDYSAAKRAGEVLCQRLARDRSIVIHRPRLPRLPTDQTATIVPVPCKDAAQVLKHELKLLKRM